MLKLSQGNSAVDVFSWKDHIFIELFHCMEPIATGHLYNAADSKGRALEGTLPQCVPLQEK